MSRIMLAFVLLVAFMVAGNVHAADEKGLAGQQVR
jgi:hypothetical protein